MMGEMLKDDEGEQNRACTLSAVFPSGCCMHATVFSLFCPAGLLLRGKDGRGERWR